MPVTDWRDSFRQLFAECGTPAVFLKNDSQLSFTNYSPFYKHHGNDPDIQIPNGASVHLRKWKYGDSPFLLVRRLTDFDGGFEALQEKAVALGESIIKWAPRPYPYPTGNCVLSGDVLPFSRRDLQDAVNERRALLLAGRRAGMGDGECSFKIVENPKHFPTLIFRRPIAKEMLPPNFEGSGCESLEEFYYGLAEYFLRKLEI
jgi:hypothetical protein